MQWITIAIYHKYINNLFAQSVVAVEYTECFSAEG